MFKTKRLILRRWYPGDGPALQSILGDRDVMRFSDHGPMNVQDQATWLTLAAEQSPQGGLPGNLAICLQENATVIGYVSLSHDPERVQSGEAELGFRLAVSAWGHGYAAEAADALIRSVRGTDQIKRIVAIVDPHNTRSVRVLDRIGLTRAGDIMFDGYDYPDHVYALQLTR